MLAFITLKYLLNPFYFYRMIKLFGMYGVNFFPAFEFFLEATDSKQPAAKGYVIISDITGNLYFSFIRSLNLEIWWHGG